MSQLKCKLVLLPVKKQFTCLSDISFDYLIMIESGHTSDHIENPYVVTRKRNGNATFDNPFEEGHNFCNYIPHHLYLVSERTIENGDKFIYDNRLILTCNFIGRVLGCEEIENFEGIISKSKKIEASTDPSLNLPLIPKNFLLKYHEEDGNISEVLIEADHTATVKKDTKWIYAGATLQILAERQPSKFEVEFGINYKLCLKDTHWAERYPNSPFTFIYEKDLIINYAIRAREDNTVIIHKVKDNWTREETKKLAFEAFKQGLGLSSLPGKEATKAIFDQWFDANNQY